MRICLFYQIVVLDDSNERNMPVPVNNGHVYSLRNINPDVVLKRMQTLYLFCPMQNHFDLLIPHQRNQRARSGARKS